MHSFFYMRTFFHMLKGLELVFWKSKKWTLIHHWLCLLNINSLRHWFKRHQLAHSTILTYKHREGWVCGINVVTLKIQSNTKQNGPQYTVDYVYCIEIPCSTDSRDIGCRTLQDSLPGDQTWRGTSSSIQRCYFASILYLCIGPAYGPSILIEHKP